MDAVLQEVPQRIDVGGGNIGVGGEIGPGVEVDRGITAFGPAMIVVERVDAGCRDIAIEWGECS